MEGGRNAEEAISSLQSVFQPRRAGTSRSLPPPHSENLEERVVEALRLTLLVGRVLPLAGKVGSPGAHFVPRQAHGLQGFLIETVFVDRNKAVCEASRHLPGPDWWAQLPVPRIW